MEQYLINFIMAFVIFGCCTFINMHTKATWIKTLSLFGTFTSIGMMFYYVIIKTI